MGLRLVPIGNGVEIVRAMVSVPMFDRGLERSAEGYGSVQMKAIDTRPAAGQFRAYDRRAIELVRERLAAEIPCAQEVILRTRA